jgi:hypothetical protein
MDSRLLLDKMLPSLDIGDAGASKRRATVHCVRSSGQCPAALDTLAEFLSPLGWCWAVARIVPASLLCSALMLAACACRGAAQRSSATPAAASRST